MKLFLSVCLAVLIFSLGVRAGAVYTNDTDQIACGIRIEFTDPMELTSHMGIFPIKSSKYEVSTFTLSDGKAVFSRTFWPSAVITRYKWLNEDATGTNAGVVNTSSEIVEVHNVRNKYKVQFTNAHERSIEINVLRDKSRESVPFTVSYHFELPHEYKVVAVVDDPGLFEFPAEGEGLDRVLVPALKIDDFNDIKEVSELNTLWVFQNTDFRIDVFEVGKNAFGYGLMFNGNNGVSLDLNGINGSGFDGVYLLTTAGFFPKPKIDLSVGLNNKFYNFTFYSEETKPVLHKFQFANFPGLNNSNLESLDLALKGNFICGGIALYNAGFYTTLDKLVEKVSDSTSFDFNFVFDTNSTEHNIRFLLVDGSGNLFTYQESVDFPLHNETDILLDAEPVSDGQVVSATWHLSNVDPTEDVDLSGVQVSYTSEWPDVRDVTLTAVTKAGNALEKKFYCLIYWKDGNPIERVGFQAINPSIYPGSQFDAVKEKLELAKQLGYNFLSYQLKWFYSWPDEDGNFILRLIPRDSIMEGDRNKGWDLSDDGIRKLFEATREQGLGIATQFVQSALNNEPELRSKFNSSGWSSNGGCFRCDEHFFYGNGEGYWNQLMHYKDLFEKFGIDVMALGEEIVAMEMGYYPEARKFYSDAIKEWKDFSGKLSYAILDCTPDTWPGYDAYNLRTNEQVLNPSRSSIPFGEMDLVSLNEYQILATRADSSVEEMYNRAVSRISGYMKKLHEVYGKPIFIGDLVCAAYEGVLLGPPGNRNKMLNNPRDDASQVKYYLAWLRAFSHAIKDLGYDWIYGLTIGSFQMIPDPQFLGSAKVGNTSGGLKVPEMNIKPRIQDTFRVYLRDNPIEN